MIGAKNYETAYKLVKVMLRIRWPLLSELGHGVAYMVFYACIVAYSIGHLQSSDLLLPYPH